MNFFKSHYKGILLCLVLAIPSHILGKIFPIIGGPVIAILLGMILHLLIKNIDQFEPGIKYTSKKILQYAVILLGFGMNLNVILQTGKESLPIIICTISASLIIAYICFKVFKMDSNIATLIGVGSSICGGSAIAATAPIIDSDEEEVAEAISVIFFFNIMAALIFPALGNFIGFDTSSGDAFGIFAGTAVNDTSSVTATAATWDNMYNLGSQTLDKAVTVKLTRTLAIIPITLILAFYKTEKIEEKAGGKVSILKIFPFFILYFVLASVITTISVNHGISADFFLPFKELSKFFIIMAMGSIGLNTNIIKLIKHSGFPILLGFLCWLGITFTTLVLQHFLGIL